MSFQFSPETFIREIDFQIEQIQSDIDNLTITLNQLLDMGPPPLVATEFEAPGFARFGVPSIPGILNQREVIASRERINGFNIRVKNLTNQITVLETEISDLIKQKRAFQNEIDIRMTIPTDVSVSPTIPGLIIPTQEQPKIDFKQLAIIGAIIALAG